MTPPAVLLVGHGSKDMEGNLDFLRMAERAKARFPGRLMRSCFIEYCDPGVPAGLDLLVKEGARGITVVPVILFAAGHVKVEVPGYLDAFRERHPAVSVRYAAPLGIQSGLFPVLERQVRAVEAARGWDADRSRTAALLIGRGSSDPDANGDLHKIARLLWEGRGFLDAQVCFSGITHPRFAEGVRRCVAVGARRIVLLPYFLYTGILLKRLQRQAEEFRPLYPGVDWGFAGELGHEEAILDVVAARAAEAEAGEVRMSCDLCRWRLAGEERQTHAH